MRRRARTSTVTQDADHLTIKFDADALDVPNPPLAPPGGQGLVQAVRLVDAITLAVDLGPRFAGFKATTQPVDTTTRLVIDFVAAQTDTAATPAPPVAPPPVPELPPGSPRRRRRSVPSHSIRATAAKTKAPKAPGREGKGHHA